MGIDGTLWNANQKLTLHLTPPQTIFLKRTSAACQQEQNQPHILSAVARTSSTRRSQPLPNVGQVVSF